MYYQILDYVQFQHKSWIRNGQTCNLAPSATTAKGKNYGYQVSMLKAGRARQLVSHQVLETRATPITSLSFPLWTNSLGDPETIRWQKDLQRPMSTPLLALTGLTIWTSSPEYVSQRNKHWGKGWRTAGHTPCLVLTPLTQMSGFLFFCSLLLLKI